MKYNDGIYKLLGFKLLQINLKQKEIKILNIEKLKKKLIFIKRDI